MQFLTEVMNRLPKKLATACLAMSSCSYSNISFTNHYVGLIVFKICNNSKVCSLN